MHMGVTVMISECRCCPIGTWLRIPSYCREAWVLQKLQMDVGVAQTVGEVNAAIILTVGVVSVAVI